MWDENKDKGAITVLVGGRWVCLCVYVYQGTSVCVCTSISVCIRARLHVLTRLCVLCARVRSCPVLGLADRSLAFLAFRLPDSCQAPSLSSAYGVLPHDRRWDGGSCLMPLVLRADSESSRVACKPITAILAACQPFLQAEFFTTSVPRPSGLRKPAGPYRLCLAFGPKS